jgi:hypothetical protein
MPVWRRVHIASPRDAVMRRAWAGAAGVALCALACHARGADTAGAPPAPAPVYTQVDIQPLEREPVLTGTFGETRGGHFHAGLDYSTGGEVGTPVRAPMAGTIERVRASGVGYGRSLYLRTADGRLLVFGHLDAFAPALARYVAAVQDSSGEYEQDLWLAAGRFAVKTGEPLGWSGESGIGAPHLHFEIRRGDMALNPLLAGVHIPDTTAPVIDAVTFEPRDSASRIGGRALPKRVLFRAEPETVRVEGRARVAVEARDPGDRRSDMEPYAVTLRWGAHWVSCRFDSVSWATDMPEAEFVYDRGRSVPARRHAVRLWAPNGFRPRAIVASAAAGEVGTVAREGADSVVTLRFEAEDVSGNRATRSVVVRFDGAPRPAPADVASNVAGADQGFAWNLPASAFFEPVAVAARVERVAGPVPELTPVGRALSITPEWLALRAPLVVHAPMPPRGTRGAGLYQNTGDGWDWIGAASDTVARTFRAESRRAGRFAVFVDHDAPRILARRVRGVRGAGPYSRWAVEFPIVERGSGLDARACRLIVDGARRPVEWDGEKSVLRWRPLDPPAPGAHAATLTAVDHAGNARRMSARFVIR